MLQRIWFLAVCKGGKTDAPQLELHRVGGFGEANDQQTELLVRSGTEDTEVRLGDCRG